MAKKIELPLDQLRELRYSINAIIEVEERFNSPLASLFTEQKFTLGFARAMVYVGLKHGGMKFTGRTELDNEKRVGDLLQNHWFAEGRGLSELMDKVSEAFMEAGVFPRVGEAAKDPEGN